MVPRSMLDQTLATSARASSQSGRSRRNPGSPRRPPLRRQPEYHAATDMTAADARVAAAPGGRAVERAVRAQDDVVGEGPRLLPGKAVQHGLGPGRGVGGWRGQREHHPATVSAIAAVAALRGGAIDD